MNIINKFKAYFEWPGLSFIFKNVQIKVHEISIINKKTLELIKEVDVGSWPYQTAFNKNNKFYTYSKA